MKKTSSKVKVVATSVTGPMHHYCKLPCQDCFKHKSGRRNFVAVVSDGAGSAKFGKIGARVICETMVDLLAECRFRELPKRIAEAVEIARGKLRRHRLNKNKNSGSLMDFSATLIGAVCCQNRKQGLFFHIGDGAGIALSKNNYDHFTASRPENGNFSCETFFYTMDDWKDSLRFTRFENADTLFLMSDGLTNFAFTPDYLQIEKGFIAPINEYLTQETSMNKAVRALNNTLNTPAAKKLNSDDKTLLWAKI